MLFALGFVSLWRAASRALCSPARSRPASVSDAFIAGHFHLVMGVAAAFAILGAFFLVSKSSRAV
jgi:heme/copper-type cytochrome/quinol oxidase subunit 1